MTQFTPSEILKMYAELVRIHVEASDTKISECLSVSWRTVSAQFEKS